jgi:predicted 3-demethylubiquinone-9 3-methyltransferase (glyoxalase superfamily)
VFRRRGGLNPILAAFRRRRVGASVEEVDLSWDKLLKAGATPVPCGWIRDPFGLWWQIVPRRLTELITDKNPENVKAATDAMVRMVKLDVATLGRAHAEG